MPDNITFNPETKDFEAQISDGNTVYSMLLSDFQENEIDKVSSLASNICSWLQSNHVAARAFCATKLLDLKNRTWLDEGEEPLSEKKFAETISLESIAAWSDGSFTLYFYDNDIFWGHSILVDVDENFVLQDAYMAG